VIARQAAAAFALVISSHALRAQDSLAFAGTDRETREALARIVRSANERGLPIYPIVSKTRLAIVVHALPARIVETAQAVADRLDAARAAIATDTLAADIAAGADALSFKVPKSVLTRIHAAAPTQPIAVPIGVLIQLVANQVPPERAGEIVTGLMRRGATTQQLVALGNDVTSDVQRGAKGGESADIRLRGLTPLLSPNATNVDVAAPIASSSGPKKP
jgi:hypothetical protein